MSTRFYFPSAGGSAVAPPFHTAWNKTDEAYRLPLVRLADIMQTPRLWLTNNENAMADPYYVLIAQYISEPLDGAAISGTFDFVMPAYEDSTNANIYLMVKIQVVSRDGNTVKATLYNGPLIATELPGNTSGVATTRHLSAAALTSFDPDPGDRLSVGVGFETDHTAGSNTLFAAGIGAGDSSGLADYALASGTAAGSGRAWIEFSQTLGFLAEDGWIDAHIPRTSSSVPSYNAQTWNLQALEQVEVASYECDIAVAGTYIFSIDGVDQATVVVASPATDRVMFTCPTPVVLTRGTHVLKLRHSSGGTTSTWYYNTNGTYRAAGGEIIQGRGAEGVQWGLWEEHLAAGGAAWSPAGTLTVRRTVNTRSIVLPSQVRTSAAYAAQTWPVSLTVAEDLYAVVCAVDTNGVAYELLIDGVQVATATAKTSVVTTVPMALTFHMSPLKQLSAGSHTFKLRRLDLVSQRYFCWNNTAGVPAGSGSAFLSSWGLWTEQPSSMAAARLVFARTVPGVPATVSATTDHDSSLLSWTAPSGVTPLSYEVRINGGTAIDVGSSLSHDFTGLTEVTNYTLEVRSVGLDGNSDWVLVNILTTEEIMRFLDGTPVEMKVGGVWTYVAWTD